MFESPIQLHVHVSLKPVKDHFVPLFQLRIKNDDVSTPSQPLKVQFLFLFSLKHTGALLRKPASSSTPSLRILNCTRVYGPQVKPGPASSQPSIRNCFAVIYALRTPSFNEAIQFVMRLADSGPLHPACPVIHHSRILIPTTKMKTPPLCPRRLLHRPSSPSQPLQLL